MTSFEIGALVTVGLFAAKPIGGLLAAVYLLAGEWLNRGFGRRKGKA